MLESIDDLDIDIPFSSKYIGEIIAQLVCTENCGIDFAFLENKFEQFGLITNGKSQIIISEILKVLTKEKGKNFVFENFGQLNFLKFFNDDKNSLLEVLSKLVINFSHFNSNKFFK